VKATTREESITKLHLKAEFIKDALSEKGYDTQRAKNHQTEKQNKNSEMGANADGKLSERGQAAKSDSKKSYYTPPSEKARSFAEEIDANI
jgi:hypothetical protein